MACGTGLNLCTSPECKLCKECKDKCSGFNLDSGAEKSCKSSCEVNGTMYADVYQFLEQTAGYESEADLLSKARTEAEISAMENEGTNKMFKAVGIIGLVLVLILVSFLIIRRMK